MEPRLRTQMWAQSMQTAEWRFVAGFLFAAQRVLSIQILLADDVPLTACRNTQNLILAKHRHPRLWALFILMKVYCKDCVMEDQTLRAILKDSV